MSDGFVLALLDASRPVPDGLIDGAARPAGRRFDVYRNNVAASLSAALRSGFPVVTRLVGRQNMDRLAGVYLRAHPPSDPLMMRYGAGFPAFLAGTRQLDHLGYLPDIARLELAIRRAYHARDAAPLAPEHLSDIPTEALIEAKLTLAPAVQLVCSDWPVFDIWRDGADANTRAGAQDVLITRPAFDPVPQWLPPGGSIWVQGLLDGLSVGAALDAALTEAPRFDMSAPLTLLLSGGGLVSLESKDLP